MKEEVEKGMEEGKATSFVIDEHTELQLRYLGR